ncbi:MAG TPA: sulfite exporter TauE/SafE family protein [Gammaproteobacteria bacterium]|nr:sulfite exporter TauE/SafE family protein [Gammaproteobacteria bacterium]
MLIQTSFLSAFLVGLLGGVHCVGMCGGIVGALTFGLPERVRRDYPALLPYLVAYNGGRILSYTVAGALLGGVGALAVHLPALRQGQGLLQVVAGLFMIALGLYLGGWWTGLARVERAGAGLWRRIEPLGRRFMPVRHPGQAFVLGLVWGWLPCGLVYSVLIWSIAAGSVLHGAGLMLSFGLGTLPTLLAMGVFAARLARVVRSVWARRLAGALVLAFGVFTVARAALALHG